jgi:transcriptional regulator with XRE-family HTH domain
MDIGGTIRAIRKRKGITIPQLCEATGLSKGFVSNLENNKTSPSIATLETIASYLKVPLPYFLLTEEERMTVIRKDERRKKQLPTTPPANLEYLTKEGPLRVMISEAPPGHETGAQHAHEGYEFHLVIKGTFLAEQGADSIIVNEGDSFSWNSSVPHNVKNIGVDTGVLLIAIYQE